jgi:pimeloyl-ACP methyl ester carboxylesterase
VDLVLDLDVPLGGRVRTTWTAPVGEPRGWAWVQHGFGRRSSALAGLAQLLAGDGVAVVRPDIAWWRPRRSMHDATWLTSASVTIARAVESGLPQARGVGAGAPEAWTLIGHSAGGAVVGHAAACLEARVPGSVAGLVLLDPVDTVRGLLARVLPALEPGHEPRLEPCLRDVSTVHSCRPSRCNRQGATVADLRRRGWTVLDHRGLSHPDPERIPAAMTDPALSPDPWAVRACGPPGSGADVLDLASVVRAEVGAAYT